MSSKYRQPFPWEEPETPVEEASPPREVAFPVKLPEDGWSSSSTSSEAETRRRRGIEGAARALHREVQRSGGSADLESCTNRVRTAVITSERKRA